MIRVNNRLIIALCVVVALCFGLAAPTLAASLENTGSHSGAATTLADNRLSASDQTSVYNPSKEISSYVRDDKTADIRANHETSRSALAPKKDDKKDKWYEQNPDKYGSVNVDLKKGGKKFEVTVTKLVKNGKDGGNPSNVRFKVSYKNSIKNGEVEKEFKQTWYYPGGSLYINNNKKGWPGEFNENMDKKRLVHELTTTNNVYKNEVRPYMKKVLSFKDNTLGGEWLITNAPWEDGPLMDVKLDILVEELFLIFIISPIRLVMDMFSKIDSLLYELPAPGKNLNPQTWLSPTNDGNAWWKDDKGWWAAVYANYGIMAGLAIPLFLAEAMIAVDKMYPRERARRLVELGKAFVFGILLGIPLLSFALHLSNALTYAIKPGASLSSIVGRQNAFDIGLGLIFGTILLIIKLIAIILSSITLMIEHFMVYILIAFWPLFWALRIQSNDMLAKYGDRGVSIFFMLIMLKILQVLILRFTNELYKAEVALSLGGFLTKIFQLVVVIGGMYFALVKLPLYVMGQLTGDIPMIGGLQQKNQQAVNNVESKVSPVGGDDDTETTIVAGAAAVATGGTSAAIGAAGAASGGTAGTATDGSRSGAAGGRALASGSRGRALASGGSGGGGRSLPSGGSGGGGRSLPSGGSGGDVEVIDDGGGGGGRYRGGGGASAASVSVAVQRNQNSDSPNMFQIRQLSMESIQRKIQNMIARME